MRIIFASHNPAKREMVQRHLDGLDIEVRELPHGLREVPETATSVLGRAREKAWGYYDQVGANLFAMDGGLWIEGGLSPGIDVRHVHGRELSDQEMVEYYSALARQAGGQVRCYFYNAIVAIIDGREYSYDGEKLRGEEFLLVDRPHPRRVAGYPLDCLAKRIEDGRYYYDVDVIRRRENLREGLVEFFTMIGQTKKSPPQ